MSLFFSHFVSCPSVSVLLAIVFLVLLSLFFGHFVACPSVPVLVAIVLLVLLSFSFGHCVACPSVSFKKGQKDKQHNGQKNRDRRTSNKMAKEKGQKDKQHNDQEKRDRRTSNTPVLLAIVLLVLLSLFLVIVLLVLLSFFLAIVFPVLSHDPKPWIGFGDLFGDGRIHRMHIQMVGQCYVFVVIHTKIMFNIIKSSGG
jgi:uncharacterized membrane protein